MNSEEATHAKDKMIEFAKEVVEAEGPRNAMSGVLSRSMEAMTKFSESPMMKALMKADATFEENMGAIMAAHLVAMAVWAEIAGIDLRQKPSKEPATNTEKMN